MDELAEPESEWTTLIIEEIENYAFKMGTLRSFINLTTQAYELIIAQVLSINVEESNNCTNGIVGGI